MLTPVRVYLQGEFRGHRIVDFADSGAQGPTFRVESPQGTRIALATVSTELLENLTPREVMDVLLRSDLAGRMRRAGARVRVIVTPSGLGSEPA